MRVTLKIVSPWASLSCAALSLLWVSWSAYDRLKKMCSIGTGELASHSDVLRGSSRVGQERVTNPYKNVCVGGYWGTRWLSWGFIQKKTIFDPLAWFRKGLFRMLRQNRNLTRYRELILRHKVPAIKVNSFQIKCFLDGKKQAKIRGCKYLPRVSRRKLYSQRDN